MFFKLTTKTKEQIYEVVPGGHPCPSWIRLVDYWYSDKGKRLSECGKQTRANKNHMHTTGPTSYANIRADFEEKNKREPSVLEIFKQMHRKKDGTFIKDMVTQDILSTKAEGRTPDFGEAVFSSTLVVLRSTLVVLHSVPHAGVPVSDSSDGDDAPSYVD